MPSKSRQWRHPGSPPDQGRKPLQATQTDWRPDAASCRCTACAVVCADAGRADRTRPQARRRATAFWSRCSPRKVMLPLQMLVEMLHVPAHVVGPVLTQHPGDLVDRHTPRRRLAKTPIRKPGKPILFVTTPIAAELPLRHPQNLTSLLGRKFLALPPVQYIPKLLHPAVL